MLDGAFGGMFNVVVKSVVKGPATVKGNVESRDVAVRVN